MRITTSIIEVSADNHKAKKIKTVSFHCEGCQSFVRSEDHAVPSD